MSSFRFSRLAENDPSEISSYTLSSWDAAQTLRYMEALEACCQRLADHPQLGRPCERIRPRLRRMEQGRHVIFYRAAAEGIVVSRILHQRMMPNQYDMEE